jgi:hypothetical protein
MNGRPDANYPGAIVPEERVGGVHPSAGYCTSAGYCIGISMTVTLAFGNL